MTNFLRLEYDGNCGHGNIIVCKYYNILLLNSKTISFTYIILLKIK